MKTNRVEGRNILDEGFGGANLRDMNTGRFSDSEKAKGLVETVKTAASGRNLNLGNIKKSEITQATSTIAENLGKNTIEVQNILNQQGDELKSEVKKLIEQLAKAQTQTGKQSVESIQKIIKQVELIKEKSPDLSGQLNLDSVAGNLTTAAVSGTKRKADNSLKAALGFGDTGFLGVGAKSKEEVRLRNLQEEQPLPEVAKALTDSSNQIIQEKEATKETNQETKEVIKETAQETAKEIAAVTKEINKESVTTTAGGQFKSGIDREGSKEVDLLEEIRDILKKIAEDGVLAGGGMGLDLGLRRGRNRGGPGRSRPAANTTPRNTVPRTDPAQRTTAEQTQRDQRAREVREERARQRQGRGPKPSVSKGRGMFKKAFNIGKGVLGKVALPVTAGLAAYDAYKGATADPNAGLFEKVGNAGSSMLNTFSFGLAGRSADEIREDALATTESTIEQTYSSDNPLQMGPGDEKEYNNRLEEINNANQPAGLKAAQRRQLDAEYRAKFGGTPQDLETRELMQQPQNRETRELMQQSIQNPKLKELNEKAASAEIAYNENPTEENYRAMADATSKSDEYILENNIPNANALINMSPSDPSRMLMTGSDSASGLERIEPSSLSQANSQVVPTGQALNNTLPDQSQTSPTVINNVTNNNTAGGGGQQQINVAPDTVRNSESVLQRRNDLSFGY